MKIRDPRLVRAAGWIGAAAVRGLVRSLRVRYHCDGPDDIAAGRTALPHRHVYAIWHENLLLPTAFFGGPDLAVLISGHADGQILGGLVRGLGMTMVNGSSTRGGVEAVRQLVRPDAAWRNLAVTPDGPRGPRRVVQPGVVYVASRAGMRLVPVGVGYRRAWRLRSWDRFAFPRPLTCGRVLLGVPIDVPGSLRAAGLEEYRVRLQAEMEDINARAERWAAGEPLDPPAGQGATRRAA